MTPQAFARIVLAELAIEAERARQEAQELERQRDRIHCTDDTEQRSPCWRRYIDDGYGDGKPLPPEEWCEACRERTRVHRLARVASTRRRLFRTQATTFARRIIREEAKA